MAGPIAPTQAIGGLYLIRSGPRPGNAALPEFARGPPIIGPNVLWDSIVRINPNGTGLREQPRRRTTPLDPLDITHQRQRVHRQRSSEPVLPAATRPPEEWTYNLWPRNGVGLNVQVSDLCA